MSNETITTGPVARFLDDDAMARIEALKASRQVLQAVGFTTRGSVDKVDLIDVARYIAEGNDPNAEAIANTLGGKA